ncbi:MAG: helix-turn-helix domain-containing protein [Spirochaetaceae bacterium]|nr:helix-turn-helix domain-containing protein [Spirochaetaceae bacterium]
MQEISSILIEARKSKGLDLEQVVRDTNISKLFLEGLESDNYADFPAETYVLGFLRNYAIYLGLDAEYIVKLYKQTRLQESELPQEAMFVKKPIKKGPILIAVGVLVLLGLVSFLAIFLWNTFISNRNTATNTDTETVSHTTIITENVPKNYEITDSYSQYRLFVHDTFSFTVDGTPYTFKVAKLENELALETERLGTQVVKLADSLRLDVNDDTITDIEIMLADIDKDPSKGALLHISTGSKISNQSDISIDGSTTSSQQYTTLFEGASAYPITMNITFRNYCFFRYEIDIRAASYERRENYYQRNATLSIKAENGFRIWASNGNALKIELVGAGRTVDLELTRPGEVIVQDIKWIRDEQTGRYRFVVMNVD